MDMFKQQDIYKAAKRKGVSQLAHEDNHESGIAQDQTPEQSPNKPNSNQDFSNLHPNKRILYELQRMPDHVKKETSLLYPRLTDVL